MAIKINHLPAYGANDMQIYEALHDEVAFETCEEEFHRYNIAQN